MTRMWMKMAAAAALAVGFSMGPVATTAQADASCADAYYACIGGKPEPGKGAKLVKKCDTAFRKCAREAKRDCKKECRDVKKDAKKACRDAFKESMCPIKGPEKKACVKDARAAKKDCMKLASENCNKMCKK